MKQSSKDVLLNLLPYFAATLLAASIIFLQKPPYFTSDEETSLKMKVKIYSSTLLKEGVLLLSITDDSLAKPLSDTPKTLLNLDISSYIVVKNLVPPFRDVEALQIGHPNFKITTSNNIKTLAKIQNRAVLVPPTSKSGCPNWSFKDDRTG